MSPVYLVTYEFRFTEGGEWNEYWEEWTQYEGAKEFYKKAKLTPKIYRKVRFFVAEEKEG